MHPRIAIIVKGYPRLSETFIAQEMLGLQNRGVRFTIVSLRRPYDPDIHELHRQIKAPVLYLPEYLHHAPARVLASWWHCRRLPGYRSALGVWWRDLKRDPSRNRIRRLGQAFVLARELSREIDWLYVHYLHTPGSVGRYAALLRALPFSLSAHAKDIWTLADWEKREKLKAARWTVTCTAANVAHLRALAPGADISLLYHGLDLSRFPEPPAARPARDGSRPDDPVRLLCVARAVPKKGLGLLLQALAGLPEQFHWHFEHIGGGSEIAALKQQSASLGLEQRITWRGAQAHDQVIAALRTADLFVLPARVAADGDRDGLPNVLMEALSQELPVLATRVSAIPELIVDGAHGRLVEPDDVAGLSQALLELVRDPRARHALARAGRQRVERDFAAAPGLDRLAARFLAPDQTQQAA